MKMKPDLIICWLKHTDYPIFRATLRKHRDFFGKVIIYWSEHNRFPYYDHFIHESLKDLDVTFLDPTFTDWSIGEDWRNHATTEMLKYSTSDWVCSIEQDWFSKDWNRLLEATRGAMERCDLFGWYNPTNFPYIHPAYWFIRRETLEKTSKDFAPHPDINGCDHFAMITHEALKSGAKMLTLQDLGFQTDIISPEATDCFHLGGVNQNYLDFDERFKANNLHRSDLFYIYNYWSGISNPSDPSYSPLFHQQVNKTHVYLESAYPNINPETSGWKEFFKI
jgi:hypothetical protein